MRKILEDFYFGNITPSTVQPDEETVRGFNAYMERYKALLNVERAAVETL